LVANSFRIEEIYFPCEDFRFPREEINRLNDHQIEELAGAVIGAELARRPR
jgi:hypothetical protein